MASRFGDFHAPQEVQQRSEWRVRLVADGVDDRSSVAQALGTLALFVRHRALALRLSLIHI